MLDPVQRALDSVADSADLDWAALEAELSDEDTMSTIRALREIAAIARAHDAPALSTARALPFTWGPLEVREYLARGAHGDVYRAWDPRLEREVALKLLHAGDADADDAPYAITEGRLLARVRHPNVVAVYGADRINGEAGIWMELVGGKTLRDSVAQAGPMAPQDALLIGIAVCRGLAAVHAAGLVHRDVKAQNVVPDLDGRTILMDLSAGLDAGGVNDGLEGTPVYLAPEVLEGGRATVASDLYATGVLLFFLVTGRYPLTGTSLDHLRARHRAGDGERLERLGRLPRAFAAVVDRALSKNPADRFESAHAMSVALQSALPRRAFWSAAMIAAACVVVAAGIGALVLTLGGEDGRPALPGGGLAGAPQQVVPQKIRLPHYDMGSPSSDGATFSYVNEDGHVNVWQVSTGRSRVIAEATVADGTGLAALISPDGAHVAYSWRLPDGATELRAIGNDGTASRTLLQRSTAYEPIPVDWSPDGQTLLCWLRQRNGTSDLVLVPADSGSVRLVYSSSSPQLPYASLSPDARYVLLSGAYNVDSSDGLHLIATDGSEQRTLIATGANERLARWTGEGSQIMFLRDSPSVKTSLDAWLVAAADGVLQGEPVLVAANLGAVTMIAVTQRGAMYRVLPSTTSDVYMVSFDVSRDSVPGPPTRVAPLEVGNHVGPAWSPDGRALAYFTTRDTTPGATPARTLTIQDTGTGDIRQIPVPLVFVGGYSPLWSPDGQLVVIWGRNEEQESAFGYFQVDVHTGAIAPLASVGVNAPAWSQFSRDGRQFLYVHPARGLVVRDLSTGTEVVSIANSQRVAIERFAVAPDGESIAFVGATETDGARVSTLHVQHRDGQLRELARAVAPAWVRLHAWTPDGGYLLFARGTGAKPHKLSRIPAHGGEATDIELSLLPTPNPISVSPDGQRIAYSERVAQYELWITPAPVAAATISR